MNTVTKTWLDRKNRMGRLEINGKSVPIAFVNGTWNDKTCSYSQHIAVIVAHDWNMSSPITIKAATLATLVKKIEKCAYKLIRF